VDNISEILVKNSWSYSWDYKNNSTWSLLWFKFCWITFSNRCDSSLNLTI